MDHDMNMDLGLDAFLEPESDFIQDLCEQLEKDGIHLTNELLVQILSSYEEHKYGFFKEIIEKLVGGEDNALALDGNPAVIQVVMDGKRHSKKDKKDKDEQLIDLDSDFLS